MWTCSIEVTARTAEEAGGHRQLFWGGCIYLTRLRGDGVYVVFAKPRGNFHLAERVLQRSDYKTGGLGSAELNNCDGGDRRRLP